MARNSGRRGGRGRAIAYLLGAGLLCTTAACKVMTIEEDRALRARRSEAFDATAAVERMWAPRVVPALAARAVPAAALDASIAGGLEAAGGRYGRRGAPGSAWAFAVSGSGRILSVDDRSRQGSVTIAIDGAPAARPIRLQIGPIVAGDAIREATGLFQFDDFADQLAFADVGRALNRRALGAIRPAIGALRPGGRVRFLGATAVSQADAPLVVMPVRLAVEPAA